MAEGCVHYVIELFDVSKTYRNGTSALQNVSIRIQDGEFVYVVGPSGAGKSTFIKLMYREERPTKGHVFVNGFNLSRVREKQIPLIRRGIGVIFQDFKLLPRLTVYENVAFALEVVGFSRSKMRKRVEQVLGQVGLGGKEKYFPHEMSGGEQQRVAIARAIVNSPSVILADEPTGNLDPDTSWEIAQLIQQINMKGTTIVMATHNREIVNGMRHRVIAIEKGTVARDQARGEYGYDV